MINFIDVGYNNLTKEKSQEMYSLRKKVFKDRLDWEVLCNENMEFDEYDNSDTTYLFGIYKGRVICSLRIIEIANPNMITGTFSSCFNMENIPKGNYVESSRFFVDKERVTTLGCEQNSITLMLILSLINYCLKSSYEGILTIVSHAMYIILKRSGLHLSVVEQGFSESQDKIYLLLVSVDDRNQDVLNMKIHKGVLSPENYLKKWPFDIPFQLKQV
ncbi:acyl-homoserine-lactone synthase [Rouxiella badensis]|jgi:N-acyl-L-homoserine lactone synthetase|uniref:acyl-homoserine-lactone synthase n=1 Tax=Rouxiella badensis TaxID=1646377 RepID=UPI0013EF0B99|nr:acyl-homoserine-lactone synthase [Rouxiella badensis]MCC3702895.1 acyl-homoserine-lactone synthase [Rouxiella badensis]MCC3720223.1 acyl-homoserine-lactone synthase [Rouxiella badensis]MCC3729886.1 acyl-homoserine-lactone synthase [Rouxiella badensis]MCC3733931.1 acyl-homoserine-lactone synthase [Rouxiella badensis]MCC3741373.1 acyl-homoserine-lactone synthase [Rouxiella badensis]